MVENDAPNEPAGKDPAVPWATVEPTSATGHVMGVRTHTGHATFPNEPMRRTSEHLRLLGILSYVYGGLQGIGVFFGLIYVGSGLVFFFIPPTPGASQANQPPPEFIGLIFITIGTFIIVLTGVLMTLTFISARDLMLHRRRTFCYIVAATHCINIPVGVTLAIFTFIVLAKPEAKALFERNAKRD